MTQPPTLLYLQAGPVVESLPVDSLLRLEPDCRQKLGPLRYDSHYHVSFFEADGPLLAPFCSFVQELTDRREFTLRTEDRLPLLRFLLREKFYSLAQILFQNSLLQEELLLPLLTLALARPTDQVLLPSTQALLGYFRKVEPYPVSLPEQSWMLLLRALAGGPLADFQLFHSWLDLSDCSWENLQRKCSLAELEWILAYRRC